MATRIYSAKVTYRCEDTGEIVTGDKYLSSKHWKLLRQKVYDYYGGKCQRCGDSIPLNLATIHHRIYKRMGKEKMTDLLLYCDHCHKCVHKGRKETHQLNGNLQALISKLTKAEKQEAFDVLVKHFGIEVEYDEDGRIVNDKNKTNNKSRASHNG